MRNVAARLLYLIAATLARLPWPWLMWLADTLARCLVLRDTRMSRVTRRNLEIIFPTQSLAERALMHAAILRTTARQALETMRMWTRPHAENLGMIHSEHGVAQFDAALASGRGLIVAAPHYGNWELLNHWLAMKTPLAILYAPPESPVAEAFLNIVRADSGSAGRVTQVRAEASTAVRRLLKLLQQGSVVGILPDQQPKLGDGEFAAFFAKPALTMTLLPRLAARTGATVLFVYCERMAGVDGSPVFSLHVEPAPAAIADPDLQVATAAMNATVERIARRDPTQYQWTYKRFSRRPNDSGETNPYFPDCY